MIPLRDTIRTRTVPFVTRLLVVANVAAFVLEFLQGENLDAFLETFAFIPLRFFHPELAGWTFSAAVVTIFTAMFLHGGLAAPPRKHAFSLDLRRQRRGRARPLPVSRLLFRGGRVRDPSAGVPVADFGDPESGRFGRDRGRPRGVLRVLPARPHRDRRPALHSLSRRRGSGGPLSPRVVRAAVLDGIGAAHARRPGRGVAGRRRVLGARRRIRLRRRLGADLPPVPRPQPAYRIS